MPGPIDSLRFVHSALCAEASAIEDAVRDASQPTDLSAVTDDVQWYAEISDLHMLGEEKGLFPKLAEQARHVDATYLYDHEEERARLSELVALTRASAGGDADALSKLRRLTVAVSEHIHAHVAKENELILPLVAELYSAPEQGAIVQEIIGAIPPEKMARAVPWIVGRVSIDEAEAYVRALSGAMPPPVFEKARGWIADGVDAERVTELRTRVPELAG